MIPEFSRSEVVICCVFSEATTVHQRTKEETLLDPPFPWTRFKDCFKVVPSSVLKRGWKIPNLNGCFYRKKTIYKPIGSMYGIYANIGGILMGSMLPYIAAPWIRWEIVDFPFSIAIYCHVWLLPSCPTRTRWNFGPFAISGRRHDVIGPQEMPMEQDCGTAGRGSPKWFMTWLPSRKST